MQGLEVPAAMAGTLILLVVLWDTFETMILPRGNGSGLRLTRFYFRIAWGLWRFIAHGMKYQNPFRQRFLAVFGPLSLVFLIVFWATLLILGFGLLLFGIGSTLAPQVGDEPGNVGDYLYLSGVTLFTLGYGDKAPLSVPTKILCVLEAGVGFGLLATVIGYLPTLYQAFARREVMVSRLHARTGAVPSAHKIVEQHRDAQAWQSLEAFLAEWENWGAELLESYRSYPVLAFYRSQKEKQSWLMAAITICDVHDVIEQFCPPETEGRGALLLQAAATRSVILESLKDLAGLLRLSTEKRLDETLSEWLLLVLPPGSRHSVE